MTQIWHLPHIFIDELVNMIHVCFMSQMPCTWAKCISHIFSIHESTINLMPDDLSYESYLIHIKWSTNVDVRKVPYLSHIKMWHAWFIWAKIRRGKKNDARFSSIFFFLHFFSLSFALHFHFEAFNFFFFFSPEIGKLKSENEGKNLLEKKHTATGIEPTTTRLEIL